MKNKRIIKKNFIFQQIIKKSNSIKNNSFVVYYKKNEEQFFKYGISVGKKLGNAVIRNKIKRKTRQMIQKIIKEKFENSFDIIIIVRNQYLLKNFDENYKNLKKIFEKIK